MTKQFLLTVWTNETRLHRGFVTEDHLVFRLRKLCKGIKKTVINTALVNRLKSNAQVKVGKGLYTIKLFDAENDPEVIADYKKYLKSQLPTFVEYLFRMREVYCPDLESLQQKFKAKINDNYSVDTLGYGLLELQKAETEVIMWRKLIGEDWSVVGRSQKDNEFESAVIYHNVIKYLDKVADDILAQASYGAASSTSPMSNVLENIRHEEGAKWYRNYAREIRSLKEGEDYQ